MKITLVGYMGSGKTFVGKKLAQVLQWPFYDLDTLLEEQENATISHIINSNGELYFRKKENELLNQLLANNEDFVLSLGGGTPVFYDAMKAINDNSTSVYLQASPTFLAQRLENEKDHRPLIAHISKENLPEFIGKHLFERNPFYQQAQFQINIENKTAEEIINSILQKN